MKVYPPLVSVVIPVYNADFKIFDEAMTSIFNQTYKNIEIIVVDDSSTNGVDDFIQKKYGNKVIYLRNEVNLGVAKSLNRAISISRGEYIARMDADDISSKNRIEKQVSYLEKHNNVCVLGTSIKYIGDRKGKYVPPCKNDNIRSTMFYKSPFVHPTIMFRKKILDKFSYNSDFKAEDYELWTRISIECQNEFHNLPDKLLKYRIHPNQVTQHAKIKISENSKEIIRKYLINNHIAFSDEAFNNYFNCFVNIKLCTKGELISLEKLINQIISNSNAECINKFTLNKTLNNRLFKIYTYNILYLNSASKAIKESNLKKNFPIRYIVLKLFSIFAVRKIEV